MKQDKLFIFTLAYTVAFFLLYKFFTIKSRMKRMDLVMATCTDITIRQTYAKKEYIYYFSYDINGENYTFSEKRRLPIFQAKIKIHGTYSMYANKKKETDYVSPLDIISLNFYLILGLVLIVLPLLFFR